MPINSNLLWQLLMGRPRRREEGQLGAGYATIPQPTGYRESLMAAIQGKMPRVTATTMGPPQAGAWLPKGRYSVQQLLEQIYKPSAEYKGYTGTTAMPTERIQQIMQYLQAPGYGFPARELGAPTIGYARPEEYEGYGMEQWSPEDMTQFLEALNTFLPAGGAPTGGPTPEYGQLVQKIEAGPEGKGAEPVSSEPGAPYEVAAETKELEEVEPAGGIVPTEEKPAYSAGLAPTPAEVEAFVEAIFGGPMGGIAGEREAEQAAEREALSREAPERAEPPGVEPADTDTDGWGGWT